jgi:hypothetical protein
MTVTQRLRELIEDASAGYASTDDLHNELLNIERKLNLPLTTVSEEMACQ